MNKKSIIVCSIFLIVINIAIGEIKTLEPNNKISEVTLYRSQALVSRKISIDDAVGELAILIKNLPVSINPESLFATSDTLKIRSVRYFTEYIINDNQKSEIYELNKKLKNIEVAKQKLQPEFKLLELKNKFIQQLEKQYISNLGPKTVPVSDKNITTSGFDFTTIEKMTSFIFQRQQELMKSKIALDDKLRIFDNEKKVIADKLKAISHGRSRQQGNIQSANKDKFLRKAMIYITKKTAKPANLTLNYIVNNASWKPTYNMRVTNSVKSLNLEYLAHIQQLTGENWSGVKLTLSTATPNMNAEIPILAPMWTNLVPIKSNYQKNSSSNLLMDNWLSQRKMNENFQQMEIANYDVYNIDLNKMANGRQNLEFNNRKDVLKKWYKGIDKIHQEIAVEYDISDTITLASRKDKQMVQILSSSIKSNLYYEAVPLFSSYVSRGIKAENTLNQPLLPGEYSAFIDGQYVGAGSLPLTVTGQSLFLGFGIDPQLKCQRELIDKTESTSWGNKYETYTYRFNLENFKSKVILINLLDRIPVTKDNNLNIVLKKGIDKLSTNKDYIKFDKPNGILRWDMLLPASTSGANATNFEYSFDIKFDADMRLSTQGKQIEQLLKKDLIKLNKRRGK